MIKIFYIIKRNFWFKLEHLFNDKFTITHLTYNVNNLNLITIKLNGRVNESQKKLNSNQNESQIILASHSSDILFFE